MANFPFSVIPLSHCFIVLEKEYKGRPNLPKKMHLLLILEEISSHFQLVFVSRHGRELSIVKVRPDNCVCS